MRGAIVRQIKIMLPLMEKWFLTQLMACSNGQAAHIQLYPTAVSHFWPGEVGTREEPEGNRGDSEPRTLLLEETTPSLLPWLGSSSLCVPPSLTFPQSVRADSLPQASPKKWRQFLLGEISATLKSRIVSLRDQTRFITGWNWGFPCQPTAHTALRWLLYSPNLKTF